MKTIKLHILSVSGDASEKELGSCLGFNILFNVLLSYRHQLLDNSF